MKFGPAAWLVVCAVGIASAAAAQPAEEELEPGALFKGATDALAQERPTDAIGKLEALADRGVVDAVVSFDRGLGYCARVRAGAEQPGDLGRAAHGFEEARELTHDPALAAEATNALAVVRSEVARRRARAGESVEIEHGFSLGRAVVGLLSENAWAALGLVLALLLSAGVVVRSRATLPRVKVAATTTASVAGALLAVTALIVWAARDARLHLREGIVITPSARLLDARRLAIEGIAPVPEGIRARIVEESAGFSRVVVGGADGWLPQSSILPLARR